MLLPADRAGARVETSATRARDLLDDASRHRPRLQEITDTVQADLDLARARLLQGKLDGALEAAAPALELAPGWRVEGVVTRAAGLRADLARITGAPATAAPHGELADRIEHFVAITAGSQFGGRPAIS
ncbi:hypothetical protein [Kitasatospora sp. NPDC088134]|uniref:hypothetical protein n=1 Tax=Kitasatospora sp. NPDC088134 TaxID=3364071 RepID=UPI0038269231